MKVENSPRHLAVRTAPTETEAASAISESDTTTIEWGNPFTALGYGVKLFFIPTLLSFKLRYVTDALLGVIYNKQSRKICQVFFSKKNLDRTKPFRVRRKLLPGGHQCRLDGFKEVNTFSYILPLFSFAGNPSRPAGSGRLPPGIPTYCPTGKGSFMGVRQWQNGPRHRNGFR